MSTVLEVLHRRAEPYRVALTRGQKGGYGWEITVSGDSLTGIILTLKEADQALKNNFGAGDVQ